LGIETIGVDGSADAPGLPLAATAEVGDILDPILLAGLARKHRVHGIYAAAELAVEAVAVAATELGLPGLSPAAATRARNKLRMREALARAGLPVPAFRGVTTAEEAADAAEAIGFPLIVKPADANSSKGVQRVDAAQQVAPAFHHALPHARSRVVLLEGFLDGVEFGVDGLIYEGAYRLGGITAKKLSPLPYRYDQALFMPPPISDSDVQAIETCVADALHAIGVVTATTHVEVMMTADGPRIVEMAARPGGALIPTDLIPNAHGFDFIADSLRLCVGEAPRHRQEFNKGACIYWLPAEPGLVEGFEGVEEAKQLPGVLDVFIRAKRGDVLAPRIDCVTRDAIGYVLTRGETAQEALATAEAACLVCRVVTSEVAVPL
ncbi:MAG: ATP-grasp domain-containing protein, partial [Candidatus Hydrogenedentales bacterium]